MVQPPPGRWRRSRRRGGRSGPGGSGETGEQTQPRDGDQHGGDQSRDQYRGQSRGPSRGYARGPGTSAPPVPQRPSRPPEEREGYVLVLPDGRPILRTAQRPSEALNANPNEDALISPATMVASGLRPGDFARVLVDVGRGR